ncbi:Protein HIR1 [Debaryomyces fabryi]|uniref:Protein HIR n=1 Tax=Debaryomyces fabryi TaxID=58627 RepID=A0A0V1PXN1_9ASCO|nr:Protein HIR1 [Debaryomyces fabryi]KSA01028.1 Protein HIR1 [Debaryomyces fabryi]
MSRHNGVVTSVKFSPDGRFLASGSDDKIVLIWEKDEEQANRPKQFGEAEADLEHWTVRKRLVAHDNDVQDICWSPDGSLLVTVGLDRLIIIWNGLTFERIKRYDIHQSMVKGIVFDPANKFFATASDDRSVRIFRYYRKLSELSINNYEFQMEHIVIDPFKKSPLTSYFRRMSWSPDGQHIAVPNATNGPVTSVAIINRTNWGTDISLIGHEAPCEVCSFSPRLFEYDKDNDSQKNKNGMGNFTTILATAGQDQNLVIWTTRQSKPLVVAHDIVSGSITDICWAPDGQTLYFSCLDGSITCVSFDDNELGKVVSENMNDLQLHRYGADRESATFPESVEQLVLEEKSEATEYQESKKIAIAKPPTTILKSRPEEVRPKELSPKLNNLTPKQVNKLTQSITITKNGKKRVAPLLVSSSSKSSVPVLGTSGKVTKKFQIGSKLSQTSYFLPRLGVLTSVQGLKLKNLVHEFNHSNEANNDDQDNDNEDMGIDSTKANDNSKDVSSQSVSEATLRRQRNKIKRAILETRYPSCFQLISTLPDNLFNNQAVLNSKVNQILNNNFNSTKENNNEIISGSSIDAIDEDLLFSVIVNGIQSIEDPKDTIINDTQASSITSVVEVRNGPSWKDIEDDLTDFEYGNRIDFQDPTSVIVSNNQNHAKRSYTLFFPYKIQHVLPIIKDKILIFYVFASFNGTIQIVLAKTGKLVSPGMEVGSNVVLLKQGGDYLMCITNQGLIYVWKLPNLPTQRFFTGIVRGIALAPILNSNVEVPTIDQKNVNKRHANIPQLVIPNVRKLDIDPQNGSPLVMLEDNNDVYKFSLDLMVWIKVVDPWYFLALAEALVSSFKAGNCVDSLLHKSYKSFGEDVKRSKIGLYIFNNTEEANELQKVMEARFKQSIELAGQIA